MTLQGLLGYIDNWVIKPVLQDARDFKHCLSPVKFNGKWGYILKKIITSTNRYVFTHFSLKFFITMYQKDLYVCDIINPLN